jgi:tRNA(fMet)-specific endonuclease VapC
MLVLDTDHLSLLMWKGSSQSIHLQNRLDDSGDPEIVTTVINYEEQARGWLALSSRARSTGQLVEYYRRLSGHLDGFRSLEVLEFDRAASIVLEDLKKSRVRIGTMDLRIASIVLSRGATLLSRNLGDFRKVPDLKVEDWSA